MDINTKASEGLGGTPGLGAPAKHSPSEFRRGAERFPGNSVTGEIKKFPQECYRKQSSMDAEREITDTAQNAQVNANISLPNTLIFPTERMQTCKEYSG